MMVDDVKCYSADVHVRVCGIDLLVHGYQMSL